MTNEERVERIRSAEHPEKDLATLFYANMPLIRKTAARYARDEDELEDLIQECFFPLVDAVAEYDLEAECSFISYFIRRCQWHLFRYMSRQGPVLVPSHIYLLAGKLRAFENEHGGHCTDEEAAAALEVPLEAIDAARIALASRTAASLEKNEDEPESLSLSESIADESQVEIFHRVDDLESLSLVWSCVDMLPARQSYIIREYYQQGKTFHEIAEDLGVCYQRVAQLRQSSLPVLARMQKMKELALQFDYDSSGAMRRSRQAFNNGGGSAPEWIIEQRERHGLL